MEHSLHLTPQQWQEDVDVLARELPKRHVNAFHHLTRTQFDAGIADLKHVAKRALCRQVKRSTEFDESGAAKYRFVIDFIVWRDSPVRSGIPDCPRLNWKGKRSPFLKGFPRGRPFFLPPRSIKVVRAIVIFSSNMAILD